MPSPDSLANDLQAAELFDAVQTNAFVFGMDIGSRVLWDIGQAALPEAIRVRSDLTPEQAEGYSILAFAPKPVKDEAFTQLFGDKERPTETVALNLWRPSPMEVPAMQYRMVRDFTTDQTTLNKYNLGEPVDFAALDEAETSKKYEEFVAEIMETNPDEEWSQELSDEDALRLLALVLRRNGEFMDEILAKRQRAEELARIVGLTAVFADEAEGLLALIAGVAGA